MKHSADDRSHDQRRCPQDITPIKLEGALRRPSVLREAIGLNSSIFEVELVLLAFATGVQDIVAFPDFGCFASNQTGNTVLLAVGALNVQSSAVSSPLLHVDAIAVSLGLFIAGVIVQAHIANALDASRKRWWLVLSSLLQTAVIIVVAILQRYHAASTRPDTAVGKVALACLAGASGAQVALVRAFGITENTTAMATATWVDIFMDVDILASPRRNKKRNRRLAFLVALIAGSFVGAVAYKYCGSWVPVTICAGLKGVAALLFLVCPAEKAKRGP